tara:strand:+ start:1142 stop:1522 length:381 start_codon:yes stop_codon:yes gene_type:complete
MSRSNTVLVIESEPWLGDHYQRQLEADDFTVVRATNALVAIDIIDETPPVAIVMSMLLDGPGAFNLLHELQSYRDTASIPIITCSKTSDLEIEELRPYGVTRIIDSTTMELNDVVFAVRSTLAEKI